MKQVLQDLASGATQVVTVPAPGCRSGALLIASTASLVSLGTERMIVEFGQSNLFQKARQQPDKVRQVIEKAKTDGLLPTIDAVRAKLSQPVALGYCNVGRVLEVGAGAEQDFSLGDRVVSNGPHAEVVCVAKNLCARIPDAVADDEATFTVLGAIALQGVRLLAPTLGEAVVVTGLGLIGLIAVQILRANGCRVLGIDMDPAKCALAQHFGAETVDLSTGADAVSAAGVFSRGRGIDGVVITASTQSSEPVHQAATMCRKRGRIVLVGVVGLELSRADFYEKELSFQVSCSYGPGRYDPEYEQKGHDYPAGFVRWTEQRNFEAVLDLMVDRKVDARPLITHRFGFDEVLKAYEHISDRSALGIVLQYRPAEVEHDRSRKVELRQPAGASRPGDPVIGVIGAGGFTAQMLLPALKATGARLKWIASTGGVTATHLARKFGFEVSTSEASAVLDDPDVTTVVVTTRHDTHARFVIEALAKGKRVFVEKPLCLTADELEQIAASHYAAPAPFLMVGFNRRFSPHVQKMHELLASSADLRTIIVTVNAGPVPRGHWTRDEEIGGGRIIGEACHFIDLLRFLADSPINEIKVSHMADEHESLTASFSFENGSLGALHYLANGNKKFPKERVEVFCDGRILQLNNFRELVGFGWPAFKKMKLWQQDKGHASEMQRLIDAVRTGQAAPMPFEQIVEVTRASFKLAGKAEGQ